MLPLCSTAVQHDISRTSVPHWHQCTDLCRSSSGKLVTHAFVGLLCIRKRQRTWEKTWVTKRKRDRKKRRVCDCVCGNTVERQECWKAAKNLTAVLSIWLSVHRGMMDCCWGIPPSRPYFNGSKCNCQHKVVGFECTTLCASSSTCAILVYLSAGAVRRDNFTQVLL